MKAKMKVIAYKFGGILGVIVVTGILGWLLCADRADVAQYGAGWIMGALTAGAAAAALVWHPKEEQGIGQGDSNGRTN